MMYLRNALKKLKLLKCIRNVVITVTVKLEQLRQKFLSQIHEFFLTLSLKMSIFLTLELQIFQAVITNG